MEGEERAVEDGGGWSHRRRRRGRGNYPLRRRLVLFVVSVSLAFRAAQCCHCHAMSAVGSMSFFGIFSTVDALNNKSCYLLCQMRK